MNNLFKAKKFLTLESTAQRLSSVFEENVCVNDVLQLALDDQIQLCWYIQSSLAVQVEYVTILVLGPDYGEEFCSTDKKIPYVEEILSNLEDSHQFRVFIYNGDEDQDQDFMGILEVHEDVNFTGLKKWLPSGAYKIHMDTSTIKQQIEEKLFGKEVQDWSTYYGLILEDEDEILYRLIDPFADKDSGCSYPWQRPPYSADVSPKFDELVILATELTRFEKTIQSDQSEEDEAETPDSQRSFSENITNTETWQNLYKLTEKALDKFPSWQKSQPKPHKIKMNVLDDWLADTLKATKREAETIKKIIIEIFNI